MALIYDSRWRSIDSSGNPYSGATLTIYTATTTTLASVYSDVALTVPLTNPVVADSAGRFPQIFAEEAALFDILEKTSGGVLIASYEDVSTLGSDTGAFTRDFTTSRFAARADGGTVRVEAGDPSPDNTGGVMELGGWNGTQADSITADAVLFDTTGRIKEVGKKIIGVVTNEATTFTTATTVDIPLPNDPTGVRIYELELFDFFESAVAAVIGLRMNFGAGVLSGATDYNTQYSLRDSSTLTVSSSVTTSTNLHLATANAWGVANKPGHLLIRIITPTSGTMATRVISHAHYINNLGNYIIEDSHGFGPTGQGRCTAIQLMTVGGVATISGKYILRTLRGSGDA